MQDMLRIKRGHVRARRPFNRLEKCIGVDFTEKGPVFSFQQIDPAIIQIQHLRRAFRKAEVFFGGGRLQALGAQLRIRPEFPMAAAAFPPITITRKSRPDDSATKRW